MSPPQPSKPSHLQLGKSGKCVNPAGRTTFLSVKKFRLSRGQNVALIAGAVLIIAALLWSVLYFFR